MNPLKRWLSDAKTPPSLKYVDTCDGLRAMAVLLVAWFHIWQQSWLFPGLTLFGREISLDPLVRSGYIWVDMMILISGFCLYLPWARMRYEGGERPSPVDFYVKRLARIHPSYLLTIAVMFAVALATDAYWSREHMLRDVLSHLTYTHMFFYDAYYASNLGGALWTLALEMQLYLLFPLIARAFYKLPATTFAAMVGIALAFRGWVGVHIPDVSLWFNQLPAYLDTFALGMMAAAVHAWIAQRRSNALTRILCSLLCFVIAALFWQVVRRQAGNPGVEAIRLGQMNNRLSMGLLGAALLLCSANAGLILRRLLSNRLTKFLAAVSLQFYIWHQTIAVWILEYRLIPSPFENPNWEGDHAWQVKYTIACFAVSLIVAAVLTYGFEHPVAKRLLKAWNAKRKKG
ncbi:MAG: acyltransferase [Clostridia bacterium]|nr:acyltransferase [Clostridia bacterium]MBQ7051185.1 acyltransferase [Clostridia bacterium]